MSSSGTLWCNINQSSQTQMIILNGYMYVSVETAGTILKIDISNPSTFSTIVTGLSQITGITTDGTYLYTSQYQNNNINRYLLNGTKDNTWTINTGKFQLENIFISVISEFT